MNEFKIGDKVRLRDDLEVGEKYDGVVMLSGMEDLKGKELTIYYKMVIIHLMKLIIIAQKKC